MFDLLPYAGDVGIPFITCIDFAQVMILLHCLFTAGSGAVVQNEKLEIRERLRELSMASRRYSGRVLYTGMSMKTRGIISPYLSVDTRRGYRTRGKYHDVYHDEHEECDV